MAAYLYRLGRFAAHRSWTVVITWLLLLGLVGGAAAAFGRPFTGRLDIPGTEFQTVLDDLEVSLPQAAGGIGTVVIRTTDGRPFTDAQRRAIADLTARWSDLDGVDVATDPFATQRQLDDAAAKATDGRARLEAGRAQLAAKAAELEAAKAKLLAGQRELDANAARLADGEQQLAAAQAQVDAGQAAYDANAARAAAARRQVDGSAAQLAQGQAQLDAKRAELTAARALLTSKSGALKAQLADLSAKLTQAQAARTQLQTQLAELTAQYGADDARTLAVQHQLATVTATITQLTSAQVNLATGQDAIAAQASQLAAGEAQLAAKQAELNAARAQLDAARRQVVAGEQQLAAARAQLDAGRATLSAKRAELDDGRARLAAAQTQLDQGRAQLTAGAAALDAATKELPAQEAALVRGERQIAVMKGLRFVDPGGRVAVSQVRFTTSLYAVPTTTKAAIPAAAAGMADLGLSVDYSKDIVEDLNLVGPSELLGIVVAGIVLLVMLGSLLAAGLPLLTALVGVGAGLLGTVAATRLLDMHQITPALALMLGLAVGIDYSLFLVNRHREQLAGGADLRESIARATGTAGGAVLFAGLTVIVALGALSLTGIPFLGIMGWVAAATVGCAVLVALTLTPAALGLMGDRVLSPKARRAMADKLAAEEAEAEADDAALNSIVGGDDRHAGHGHGWGGLVTRHPVVTLLLATVALAGIAVPAFGLKLGLPDGAYEPPDSTANRAYAAVAQSFGPGRNGPIVAVAKVAPETARTLDEPHLTDLTLDVAERLKATKGIAYVVPIGASPDRTTLAFQVVPAYGPSDDETITVVSDLRADARATVATSHLGSLGFAGMTVANIDISAALADALPRYLGVVVGISFLLLLLVFRSLLVPALATAGFLLSVAAAFGAVVAVYQWGWGGAVFGVAHPGRILSFLPVLVIGILFGLAMDYQMFLVTGMREAWAHGHAARTAVRAGFGHGARVVAAAALIMTSVFASFVHAHLIMIRGIGFALAVGVLIDAFVVRMTVVPALMHLLGERAWWLPRWLDRLLPSLDIEGTTLPSGGPPR